MNKEFVGRDPLKLAEHIARGFQHPSDAVPAEESRDIAGTALMALEQMHDLPKGDAAERQVKQVAAMMLGYLAEKTALLPNRAQKLFSNADTATAILTEENCRLFGNYMRIAGQLLLLPTSPFLLPETRKKWDIPLSAVVTQSNAFNRLGVDGTKLHEVAYADATRPKGDNRRSAGGTPVPEA